MSRVGKKPIKIPGNVSVSVDKLKKLVLVKGSLGEICLNLPASLDVLLSDGFLSVIRLTDKDQNEKTSQQLFGFFRADLNNAVIGVSLGFSKELEISGVGYKAEVKSSKLVLNLGFSHLVEFDIPSDIKCEIDKLTKITIKGFLKVNVGQFAAKIRSVKKAEPYLAKGIKYSNEIVRRKAGKVGSK